MAITRYSPRESASVSPWNGPDQMGNRLFRLFDEGWPLSGGTSTGPWVPAVNVEETADEIVLTAELPGMERDDIELEMENNVLTLSGERSAEREKSPDRRYHVWERRFGSFQRSFTLPRSVDPEKIEARFQSGILHVHMPKLEEAKGRRIAIRSES